MLLGKVFFNELLLVCDGGSLLREDATKANFHKYVFLRNEPTGRGYLGSVEEVLDGFSCRFSVVGAFARHPARRGSPFSLGLPPTRNRYGGRDDAAFFAEGEKWYRDTRRALVPLQPFFCKGSAG